MSETKTADKESKERLIQEIMAECAEHNEWVGADEREPDRLRRDAENIYMHRHCKITVETICMMLTDLEFALKK